eukprot:2104001-Prorocentrum_lima.AAC.1
MTTANRIALPGCFYRYATEEAVHEWMEKLLEPSFLKLLLSSNTYPDTVLTSQKDGVAPGARM